MAMYKVAYTNEAFTRLKHQPAKRRARVRKIMASIATDPFAHHPNVERIKGRKDAFRYRLGDWRILYRLDRETRTVIVVDVWPRGRAYR